MAVNLLKGQKVSLTKDTPGLTEIIVGLGWDEAKRGFFSFIRPQPIDCDASAILCTKDGKYEGKSDLVYFGQLKHKSGCVIHMGDNLTGAGDGDDEQIIVNLKSLPMEYTRIIFAVNIFESTVRKQHFGLIKNAFVHIIDKKTGIELCRYNLSDDYSGMSAVICGELQKNGSHWDFVAIGQGTDDSSIHMLASRYQ